MEMPLVDKPIEELLKYEGINPCPKDMDEFWESALEEMRKIGFPIVNGTVVAYADEDGKAVMPSRARKEGWAEDG